MPGRDSRGRFVSGGGGGGAKEGIIWSEDTLSSGLVAFEPKVHAATTAAVEYHSDRAQSRMRADAPWTDQTGNARNGLRTKAFHERHKHTIVLYGSVPYQIWLEVRNSGQYAVIGPTRDREGRELMVTLAVMLRRLH